MKISITFLKIILISIATILISCKKKSKSDEYVAYFGGEITNPTNPYVLFCKNNVVLDSILLKKDNTFFIKFDSLAPGLYTFKNEPEYQTVYFDKNDSLMVSINAKDFDQSAVFCGRGDEKNNFLMELYLKNEKDKSKMFDVFEFPFQKFSATIDSSHLSNQKFYKRNKEIIKWSDAFDVVAKAAVDYHYYSKKELYPYVHKMRTGKDICNQLSKQYYDYRKNIDFNNDALIEFSPYIMYLSYMLNNLGTINYHNHYSEVDLALKTNINKLNIADTLLKNEKVKNTILNNIAFTYLMEDQNMINNQAFLKVYHKYSTDKSKKNEITIIGNAIQLLKVGNQLPDVKLIDIDNKTFSSKSILKDKTVLFFWTSKANSHLEAVHRKIADFKTKHPDYNFIGININDNQAKWNETLFKNNFSSKNEYRCANFNELKSKWAITKVHRTIILAPNGKISNAFANIFEVNFEDNLK